MQNRILAEEAATKARKRNAIQIEKETGYLIPRRGHGIKSKKAKKSIKKKNKNENKNSK